MEDLKKITYDFPRFFAQMLKVESPDATVLLLSGAGADRTEKSKTSFDVSMYSRLLKGHFSALFSNSCT